MCADILADVINVGRGAEATQTHSVDEEEGLRRLMWLLLIPEQKVRRGRLGPEAQGGKHSRMNAYVMLGRP
jgi:hypothetical protein